MLRFDSDYMEGCCPEILRRLTEINLQKNTGYGEDEICNAAREKIRAACGCPEAEVRFISGGTQTNSLMIGALLRPYEGVLSADSGHITGHEAGAIEHGGHKVLTLPNHDGLVDAADVHSYMRAFLADEARTHLVQPGMVYISHPTEYGTLYSRAQLKALRAACDEYGLKLYMDGARLGYGLATPGTDLTLRDIAGLVDAFYIGGTKVGALFGEAVVVPNPKLIPHFFTMIKQHGALLAKGWVLGLQFDTLFTDNLYLRAAENAIATAAVLREGLRAKGVEFYIDSPTNQIFPVLDNEKIAQLRKQVSFNLWAPLDETRSVIRFVTSWASEEADIQALLRLF